MNWDTTLFYWLHGLTGEAGAFDGLVVFLAEYLQYFVFIALVILLYFSAYSGREKIKIFSVAALSPLIATLIKYFIRFFYHRPRPFLTHEIQALFTNDSGSFPSGHATIFFALATSLYLYNKKWGFWFFHKPHYCRRALPN
jgi:undecaprenyl-diphosphatase